MAPTFTTVPPPQDLAHEAAGDCWRARWMRCVVGAACACSIASGMRVYPHSLSYFNELAGGAERGHEHLLNSNIDWGQDLLLLKRWLDRHKEARPLGLAYFGGFDPRAAGIEFRLPPFAAPPGGKRNPAVATSGPQPGWFAISVTALHGFPYSLPDGKGRWCDLDGDYLGYFRNFEPVCRVGYSIYIYHLTAERIQRAPV